MSLVTLGAFTELSARDETKILVGAGVSFTAPAVRVTYGLTTPPSCAGYTPDSLGRTGGQDIAALIGSLLKQRLIARHEHSVCASRPLTRSSFCRS
ncbi:hypothetical protein LAV84_22565 [Rhizobium sp. VS19-DR104.2]|uniref:hypothetical protein n=1 Tax=unclassified Rhizobium TaxID=2613769 RepID=UPI001C5AEA80|nr:MULTISPECIES: hypothetical protein [unclassified Rhizobium]MBZ5761979.1 hypothetical protein [Rhizobium sp. VS19-DR96]MBZ5768375.1 hypothetical protein [Rhizobium sp. VS19-DR129.2]MBZ5775645.1 hypothetical protein [Rhizobium sp. VS19-DRK62.2]MBZ5786857.1 hypothetical protein [Rhizobium sp. VS19-DR121]MBZ5804427.1 hypothetical protein [Rhizobium sp. VS19-DR181]